MANEEELIPINELGFGQSQGHGLFWDSQIRVKVFGLEPCINDTKKYDIEHTENKLNENENVSLKTLGAKNIGLGDALRFFDADFTRKYTIILVRYKQAGEYKSIHEIVEIDYTAELRNYLFGTATLADIQVFVDHVRSIAAGPVDPETKRKYKSMKKDLESKHGMRISINPKVDSKKQRRVQCSVSVERLQNEVPWCISSRASEAAVRGVPIDGRIHSPRRSKNKKVG